MKTVFAVLLLAALLSCNSTRQSQLETGIKALGDVAAEYQAMTCELMQLHDPKVNAIIHSHALKVKLILDKEKSERNQ